MKSILTQMFKSVRGLRHEMAVAVGLVILAFVVFLGYLFPGASSFFQIKSQMNVVMVILFFILILGFFIISQMIEPVIRITQEAKKIAAGDLNRKITLVRNDEIGELGDALNRMSQRLKDNLEELKIFSEKTEAINSEINKRILTLSGLIQISNLVSQNAALEEIIHVSTDKCSSFGEMRFSCFILFKPSTNHFVVCSVSGPDSKNSKMDETFKISMGEGFLGKALLQQDIVVVDKSTKKNKDISDFQELFSLKNAIIAPVVSRGKVHGLLIAGNNIQDLIFTAMDKEVIDLISKQISIAIENDLLAQKLEKLEVVDKLTGLFNSGYICERLNEEIQRSIRFHRSCAFAIFVIDHFAEYRDAFGYLAAENAMIKIGKILKDTISDVEKAGRFGDHEFSIIFPEKNKRQSIDFANEVRKKIEFAFSEEEDALKKLTCSGAVAENPLDGMTADELVLKARELLKTVEVKAGNRIYH